MFVSHLLSRGGIGLLSVLAFPENRVYSRRYCAGFTPDLHSEFPIIFCCFTTITQNK
jgi:hypothetical protein